MTTTAQAGRDGSGDSSIVLLLSLNLILLAFFILLNALSRFDEDRTRVVIDSVKRAFYGQLEPLAVPGLLGGSPGLLPEAEALTNEVGSMFESLVPVVRSKNIDRARVVTVELPADALFKAGEGTLRTDRRQLIRRLAKALLQRSAQDLVYELGFLQGVPGPATGAAAEYPLQVSRAADMAQFLTQEGLSSGLLSIGLRPGRPAKVEFVLTVRDAVDPPAPPAAPSAVPQ
jgi:hypothetical protein